MEDCTLGNSILFCSAYGSTSVDLVIVNEGTIYFLTFLTLVAIFNSSFPPFSLLSLPQSSHCSLFFLLFFLSYTFFSAMSFCAFVCLCACMCVHVHRSMCVHMDSRRFLLYALFFWQQRKPHQSSFISENFETIDVCEHTWLSM